MERLTQTLLNEAADWFARLQEPVDSPMTREEFDSWLLRSPAHIEAYLKVSRAWGDVGFAAAELPDANELIIAANAEPSPANVVAWSKSRSPLPLGERGRVRGAWRWPAGIAAALALTVGVFVLWFSFRDPLITTAIGEQRSVLLDDGSVTYLNTDSMLKIRYTQRERRIELLRGEARFTIAKDSARPFIVLTPQASVRALGTVFNVRALQGRTAVTVIEGRVAVSGRLRPAPVAPLELSGGEHVAVTDAGRIISNAGPNVERVMAWPQRQLVFREETLADVVAEFNRYHPRPIRIEDPTLAGIRISAVFDSSDSTSLLQYLEKYRGLEVERDRSGAVALLRRK